MVNFLYYVKILKQNRSIYAENKIINYHIMTVVVALKKANTTEKEKSVRKNSKERQDRYNVSQSPTAGEHQQTKVPYIFLFQRATAAVNVKRSQH